MKDAVAVLVFDGTVVDESALGRACGDDGDFAVEINEGFEDGFSVGDSFPSGAEIDRRCDAVLTFAVVTKVGGFENGGETNLGGCFGENVEAGDAAKGCDGEAGALEKRFFA